MGEARWEGCCFTCMFDCPAFSLSLYLSLSLSLSISRSLSLKMSLNVSLNLSPNLSHSQSLSSLEKTEAAKFSCDEPSAMGDRCPFAISSSGFERPWLKWFLVFRSRIFVCLFLLVMAFRYGYCKNQLSLPNPPSLQKKQRKHLEISKGSSCFKLKSRRGSMSNNHF